MRFNSNAFNWFLQHVHTRRVSYGAIGYALCYATIIKLLAQILWKIVINVVWTVSKLLVSFKIQCIFVFIFCYEMRIFCHINSCVWGIKGHPVHTLKIVDSYKMAVLWEFISDGPYKWSRGVSRRDMNLDLLGRDISSVTDVRPYWHSIQEILYSGTNYAGSWYF